MNKNNHIENLSGLNADRFLSSLLSQSELSEIEYRRKEKNRINKKKGKPLIITETSSSDYVIEHGALDPDSGLIVDDFDIVKYMNDMEDPATGIIRDLKVDTRGLPYAKNFYDYTVNILGKDKGYGIPWARQMWIGLMLFAEVCPCCSHPAVFDIHNIPKNIEVSKFSRKFVVLEYGVCPRCRRTKWDLIKNHNLKHYQALVNVLGQRSGKSSSSAGSYSTYLAHQYLMFPKLADLAPSIMQASTQLTATFVSLSFAKAVGVLWTPFKSVIDNSSWFKDYFSVLDDYKHKYKVELYRNSSIYLEFYNNRNFRFYPSGPRSTTLRGDTRILGVIDELGLFPLPKGNDEEDEQSERANADEAHKSLTNSLSTAQKVQRKLLKDGYSAAPPALMMAVSSPYSERDKVMRLLKESKTEVGQQYILGVQLPTWEMHPEMEKDDPVIQMAYNSNFEKAERDFGANPPRVHSRFIQPSLVQDEVFVNGQNSHTFTYLYDKPEELYGKVDRIRSFGYPSLVTIDAGAVDNSFTLVGGHYDFETGKSVCTTIIECMPHDKRRINFNLMYQFIILPILKQLNAVALLADQWQSIDLLNRAQDDMGNNPLQKPRCKAKQYSPRRKDFNAVVAMLRNKNILLPEISDVDKKFIMDGYIDDYRKLMINKPVQHLMLQMITVKDVGETRCPEKGDDFTDDIFRAFVLWASKLHEPKVMERLVEAKDWTYDGMVSTKRMPKPAVIGRSGRQLIMPGLR